MPGAERKVVGIAWYRADQWTRLREVSVDRDAIEATYAEWLAAAEKALADLEAAGIVPARVAVDVDDLVIWCSERKRAVDATARAAFVAAHLRECRPTEELPT